MRPLLRSRTASSLRAWAFLASAACPGSLSEPERFTGSVICDVQIEIFDETCTSAPCHDSTKPAGNLDLEAPGVEARLVGVPADHEDCTARLRIDPVEVQESFFLEKIEGKPECGDPMPFEGKMLDNRLLTCLRNWVAEVAQTQPQPVLPDAGGGTPPDGGSDGGL